MSFAGDAVRVIAAGGVYVNGSRVTDTELLISPDEHVLSNNLTLLRIGSFLPRAVRMCSAIYCGETMSVTCMHCSKPSSSSQWLPWFTHSKDLCEASRSSHWMVAHVREKLICEFWRVSSYHHAHVCREATPYSEETSLPGHRRVISGRRHIEFLKILTVGMVKRVKLRYCANFVAIGQTVAEIWQFFKMAAVVHLGFVMCMFGPPTIICKFL